MKLTTIVDDFADTGKLIRSFSREYKLHLRHDELNEPIVRGKNGMVYEYSDSLLAVMFMPPLPRPKSWAHVRTMLRKAGYVVVQDGDWEGAATFNPCSLEQSQIAIKVLSIKRRRVLSEDEATKRRGRMAVLNTTRTPHRTATPTSRTGV